MSALALLILLGSTASDLGLAFLLLFAGRRASIGFGRFALAAVAVGLFLAAKVLVLSALHRRFFAIHLAYVDTMIVLPLIGIALIALARKRAVVRPVLMYAWASLALIPIGIYATFVEPFRLIAETRTVPIARARAGVSAIEIAVLADIQSTRVTDHERRAVALAMSAKPDLILLPGDLVQVPYERFDAVMPQFRELLRPLDAPLGVYFVLGNTDLKAQIERLIQSTRVQLLDNRIVELAHADRRITLGGVDLAFASPAARAVLRRLEEDPRTDDLRLLVAHRPDVMFALSSAGAERIDLVVAGHTHGGQVRVPLLGPPITLSDVPRSVAAGGLHELDGVRIYVSRGVGCERWQAPRVRFLCPPEVSFLTLARSQAIDPAR